LASVGLEENEEKVRPLDPGAMPALRASGSPGGSGTLR
jgi:hypothetical protein